jgi:hypothetical protein
MNGKGGAYFAHLMCVFSEKTKVDCDKRMTQSFHQPPSNVPFATVENDDMAEILSVC